MLPSIDRLSYGTWPVNEDDNSGMQNIWRNKQRGFHEKASYAWGIGKGYWEKE
jgi:hypothetical protein